MSTLAGIVLAAGTSTRFGSANKLLASWKGQPMVQTVVESALATELEPVVVVTGHEAEAVRAALAGLEVQFVHNGDYASGQASSLKTGIAAVPEQCDGALILLADMPRISPGEINLLLDSFAGPANIVVPVFQSQRGNPVVIGRAHFGELAGLSGDTGARRLLEGENVIAVEMPTGSVLQDFDTPEAMP